MKNKRAFLIAIAALTAASLTIVSLRAGAQTVNLGKEVNDDLVVPRGSGLADDDAIQVEKKKRSNVSDSAAQSRAKPKEDQNYTRIIPFYGGEKPPEIKKKLKNGTKIYAVKESPQNYSAGIRVGPYLPTNLVGTTDNITFAEIYGNNPLVMADISFEYQFFKSLGKLGVKTDFSFFTAKGQGRFLHTPTMQADEVITLVGVPLSASGVYHLQFWDKQPIVPFIEGGLDYFTIFEGRSDKTTLQDALKYGGSPATHYAAGVQIMLDGLDREVIWQLDQEYGINHIYLTADVRQIVGLGGSFDFTSSLIYEGGILFEF